MPGTVAIMAGVKTTLLASADLDVAQDAGAGEITERIPETPILQVYAPEGDNLRQTFTAEVQRHDLTVFCELFVKQRSYIADDLKKTYDQHDTMELILEAEMKKGTAAAPFFGVAGIKSFQWRWEQVTYDYADNKYVGIRYTLELMLY